MFWYWLNLGSEVVVELTRPNYYHRLPPFPNLNLFSHEISFSIYMDFLDSTKISVILLGHTGVSDIRCVSDMRLPDRRRKPNNISTPCTKNPCKQTLITTCITF